MRNNLIEILKNFALGASIFGGLTLITWAIAVFPIAQFILGGLVLAAIATGLGAMLRE